MVAFFCRAQTATIRAAFLAGAILATAACGTSDKAPDTASSGSTPTPAPSPATSLGGNAPSPTDSTAGMKNGQGMQGMAGMAMTGDADHDFLRMMSDHHKGMILMAHMTKERKEGGPAVADARKLDTKQDAELDKMMTMLEKDYKDPYKAKVMPDNQAMADELKGKSGSDYDRTFYQNVIKHHEQAVKMVGDYLPNAKKPMIRKMAEQMKADQAKEIVEFRKKMGGIK